MTAPRPAAVREAAAAARRRAGLDGASPVPRPGQRRLNRARRSLNTAQFDIGGGGFVPLREIQAVRDVRVKSKSVAQGLRLDGLLCEV